MSTLATGHSSLDDQTRKEMVRVRLRSSLLQRANQGRDRGEHARPLQRAEERADAQMLCALAQQNDDRAGKKRVGAAGLLGGDVRSLGAHDGVMSGVLGPSAQHLHAQSRAGVCDGLVCGGTMAPSGRAGLPASLCNATSGMSGMMDDPYALGTQLGSSAPAGSYGMAMNHQHHHMAPGSAEWHAGVPAAHDTAFRGIDPYSGAPGPFPHDPAMDMMQQQQQQQHAPHVPGAVNGHLRHGAGDPAAAAAAAQMASHAGNMGRVPQSLAPGSGHVAAPPPSSNQLNIHVDAQMRDQYMRRGSMSSSVGTPTTPNHIDGGGVVGGGLDAGYNWAGHAARTSSAAGVHPSTNDYSQYGAHVGSHQPPQAPVQQQQQQHHMQANLRQQQQAQQAQHHHQQQQAGMMPPTPIIDDMDHVFLDDPSWPASAGDGARDASSLGLVNLSSPPLSHERVPNVSVVPTSYGNHYLPPGQMASHPSHQHSASQSSYFGDGRGGPADVGHRHGSTGGGGGIVTTHSGAGYTTQPGYQPTQSPGIAAAAAAAHQQQQHHHRTTAVPGGVGMGFPAGAFDGYNGAAAMTSQAAVQSQQQQGSHFNFANSGSAFSGQPQQHMHPHGGAGGVYNVGSSNPPSAGYMDSMVGGVRQQQQQQPSMSLQQILQTPPTMAMPPRMPYQ